MRETVADQYGLEVEHREGTSGSGHAQEMLVLVVDDMGNVGKVGAFEGREMSARLE